MRNPKSILVTIALSGLLIGLGASPAQAFGSVQWGDACLAGYAGSSTYASATGISHANTARSGGTFCSYIGVALRYYAGAGPRVESQTSTLVQTQRAVIAYGGWHYSTFSTQDT